MSEGSHKLTVLGLMSGTSLDGLDLALCEFEQVQGTYVFKIIKAQTVEYTPDWKDDLAAACQRSAEDFFSLHTEYARYLAEKTNLFLSETTIKPALIASHGHTVFHQPALGFTTQLGCGATLSAYTGITTISDFRSLDVALGGQGAPLVPVGDKLLFANYTACLNIGGIANISFDDLTNKRLAYDVCEANMLLNYLAQQAGKNFDENGAMARKGTVDQALLKALNGQEYYMKKGAKSMGREWFEKQVVPLIHRSSLHAHDLLATATEHVADVLAEELNEQKLENVLITGGGAFNTFLIERLRLKTRTELIIPDTQLVNFKEALVFAFLGYLRLKGKINTLSSVTGARHDSMGGAIYG